MKIKFFLIISFILATEHICGQTHPQFSYYGYDWLSLIEYENDVEEADKKEKSAKFGEIYGISRSDDKFDIGIEQILELWYRVYEIEHTSEILYRTKNDDCLMFQCKDSVRNGIPVDFGTQLIANQRKENGCYRLRFANPVSIIDPSIFNKNVEFIKLPMNDNLEYKSSGNMDVSNLRTIYGKDVVSTQFLVSKNKTLIAGALKGCMMCEIPNSVESIGIGALRGALVEEIIIPSSVKIISAYALENCYELKKIVINGENVITIDDNAFGQMPFKEILIYVSKAALKEYKKRYPKMKKSFVKMN